MKNYQILFGERLKSLRKKQHITQEKLADMVNRSKNHISKIELGCANPPLSLIIEIANALNLELCELFTFRKTQNFNPDINWNDKIKNLKNKKQKEILNNILHLLCEDD
ncbi:MAG: helix-turn-helix domain-containing protein [Candidatus Gastranaerophilales bacterium]|nr:helix-turn-helix domain-containing protein [Candidatus Gastranaerophilales bacterium]